MARDMYHLAYNVFNNCIIPESFVGILHCLADKSFSRCREEFKEYIVYVFKINIHNGHLKLLSLNVTTDV